jgi:hypothetical protein
MVGLYIDRNIGDYRCMVFTKQKSKVGQIDVYRLDEGNLKSYPCTKIAPIRTKVLQSNCWIKPFPPTLRHSKRSPDPVRVRE